MLKAKFLLYLILILAFIIRITWIKAIPPALYSDEIDQGYNAFSILQTGKDEHGSFLPVSFRSFGDWKPPLQTYLMVPFIYLFGLNEYSVRLPSVIMGTGSVYLMYLLARHIFRNNNSSHKLSLLCALLLSLAPWHILHSRSAMLVMAALFFLQGGILFYLTALRRSSYYFLSALFFSLSVFSYYGMRIIVPLIMAFLIFKDIADRKNEAVRNLTVFFFWGFLFLLPLGISFLKNPDVVFGRAKTVSIFYDQGTKLRKWELTTQDGIGADTVVTRFFHNNPYLYARSFLSHYFSHFNPEYLFITGDLSPPFWIPGLGVLYILDGIFLLYGIFLYFTRKEKFRLLLFVIFTVSFIPAGFTFMTPSSNRTFTAVMPMAIFTAYGLTAAVKRIRFLNTYFIVMLAILYSFLNVYGFGQYFKVMPEKRADIWNYGWREAAEYISSVQDRYENIFISDKNGMPYVYLLFYNKVDPSLFQKTAVRKYQSDEYGYEHVDSFGKYIFFRDPPWSMWKDNLLPRSLYVISPGEESETGRADHIVNYPDGRPAVLFIST